jgi:hypothetical protein
MLRRGLDIRYAVTSLKGGSAEYIYLITPTFPPEI